MSCRRRPREPLPVHDRRLDGRSSMRMPASLRVFQDGPIPGFSQLIPQILPQGHAVRPGHGSRPACRYAFLEVDGAARGGPLWIHSQPRRALLQPPCPGDAAGEVVAPDIPGREPRYGARQLIACKGYEATEDRAGVGNAVEYGRCRTRQAVVVREQVG